jgi:glutathione S-transferase
MITLHTFGPAFGLPDPSPFVTKVELLLKMAGLAYRSEIGSLRRAPKGKLPYIDDDGTQIADSTFIRLHLEQKYGFDFDAGLTPAERGAAWAFEKLCEDHLYWGLVAERWMNDANFRAGPLQFFQGVPAPARPLVTAVVRRQLRKTLRAQGLGRHSDAERAALMARSIATIAAFLGEKPYLMGEKPCGADATMLAFVCGILCDVFTSRMRDAAAHHPNLAAYRERLMRQYYPERV